MRNYYYVILRHEIQSHEKYTHNQNHLAIHIHPVSVILFLMFTFYLEKYNVSFVQSVSLLVPSEKDSNPATFINHLSLNILTGKS